MANASAGLAGIATQSCAALDTGSFGAKSVGCAATDVAGNSATANAAYVVKVGVVRMIAPIAPAGQLPGLAVSAPIRFEWTVTDANGAPVTGLGQFALAVDPLACPAGTLVKAATGYTNGLSQTRNTETSPGHYARAWVAPMAYLHSCRQLRLDLGDGVPLQLPVKFY